MTRTGSLAPQASITTPSGWTVTVTYRAGFGFHDEWRTVYTGPNGWRYQPDQGAYTRNDGEPNPMSALEMVGLQLHYRHGIPYLPDAARAELADAIAGMYGGDCDHYAKDYHHVYLPGGAMECGKCGSDLGTVGE